MALIYLDDVMCAWRRGQTDEERLLDTGRASKEGTETDSQRETRRPRDRGTETDRRTERERETGTDRQLGERAIESLRARRTIDGGGREGIDGKPAWSRW